VRTIRKGQHAAQRHGDDGQAEGQHQAILEGHGEIGIIEDETVRVKAEFAHRHEKRRVQKALVKNQEQRQENGDQRDRHDHAARPVQARQGRARPCRQRQDGSLHDESNE